MFIHIYKEKISDFYIKYSDIEDTNNEKINFEDKEVFKVKKENIRIKYVWYDDRNSYDVSSNINDEETLRFIENIKILKNF